MNPLGGNKEIVRNKLIIMYLLKKLGMPASNPQITELVMETRLMNYFMLHQCLNELHESKFVENSGGLFSLTSAGGRTLDYFMHLVPQGIVKRLDAAVPPARRKIRDETLVTADIIQENENSILVNCKTAEDDFILLEIKAAVGTINDARAICGNWKKHSSEIYAEIIDSLIKKRDDPTNIKEDSSV